ncbi:MAG: glycosyltransferase family 2 protein [Lachnospiraceae bacterium]|nr:glycosyltransferase family 2 protein [Lachnospiraceae bacterium]
MEPKVSICVPAYNNEDTIEETLGCVLQQTYKNIELIVVDDNSSDSTYERLVEFQKTTKDNRLKIFHNESNLGMAGNWNYCLSLCEGEYLRLLCGDDLIDSDLIRREVEILEEHPEVEMVSSDTRFVGLDGSYGGTYKRYHKSGVVEGKDAVMFSFFTRDYLGAPLANLFRRSAYEKVKGFDSTFSYIIDYDFYTAIALLGKIYIIHEPLNFFRLRPTSNTSEVLGGSGSDAYVKEHELLVNKYANRLHLHSWQVRLSVWIRRLMIHLGDLYLKVFMKEKRK